VDQVKAKNEKNTMPEAKHFVESLAGKVLSLIVPMLKVDMRTEMNVDRFALKQDVANM